MSEESEDRERPLLSQHTPAQEAMYERRRGVLKPKAYFFRDEEPDRIMWRHR